MYLYGGGGETQARAYNIMQTRTFFAHTSKNTPGGDGIVGVPCPLRISALPIVQRQNMTD